MPPMRLAASSCAERNSLVDRRGDHVLQHLGVLGVDRLRVDLDLAQLHVAGHGHLDHPPTRAGLDDLVLELLLRLGHLSLHLLGLLEDLIHVGPLGHQPASLSRASSSGTTSVASKLSLIRSIFSSSLNSGGFSGTSASSSLLDQLVHRPHWRPNDHRDGLGHPLDVRRSLGLLLVELCRDRGTQYGASTAPH